VAGQSTLNGRESPARFFRHRLRKSPPIRSYGASEGSGGGLLISSFLAGPRVAFLNYATENFKPLLHSFEYVRAAPQEPSFGLLGFQAVGERSMTRPLPMRNGLDFDPVAEFSRFGVQSVDAERSIVGHRARIVRAGRAPVVLRIGQFRPVSSGTHSARLGDTLSL